MDTKDTKDTRQRPRRIDPAALDLLERAMEEYQQQGRVETVRCDRCGDVIQITALSPTAHAVECTCGKFRDTLRGI